MQMKNKKRIWESMLLIFLIGLFFIFPAVQAANVVVPSPSEVGGLSERSVKDILTNLLKWILQIVGIIAVMGFVISGIMYLVSTGNEEVITKAKKYMTYCLIGIVVVLASFVVIQTIDAIMNASIGNLVG
jgi:Na+-driven multidrug efflux pump